VPCRVFRVSRCRRVRFGQHL